MDLNLVNKTALVTGSTAGIGFAIAKCLAAEGARVIVNGRTESRVAAAMGEIHKAHPGATLEALPLDLAKSESTLATARRFPTVDILVNNLGAYEPKSFEELTDGDWLQIIELNF